MSSVYWLLPNLYLQTNFPLGLELGRIGYWTAYSIFLSECQTDISNLTVWNWAPDLPLQTSSHPPHHLTNGISLSCCSAQNLGFVHDAPFLSHSMSKTLEELLGSTLKMYAEPHLFLPPPLYHPVQVPASLPRLVLPSWSPSSSLPLSFHSHHKSQGDPVKT